MNIVEPIRDLRKIEAMKSVLAAGQMGERNVVLFSLGINTAYRISDLRQLRLQDVLTVSKRRVVVKERLDLKEQKTGKHNSIILSRRLRTQLRTYVEEEFPDYLRNQDFEHYLFPSRDGQDQPLTREHLSRMLSTAGRAVGLAHIGAHSMRKTFGYHLYAQGTPIELIQTLLNHSSARETLRYIGITQQQKDTAVMSLDL